MPIAILSKAEIMREPRRERHEKRATRASFTKPRSQVSPPFFTGVFALRDANWFPRPNPTGWTRDMTQQCHELLIMLDKQLGRPA